jgi:hypothetical protein
MPFQDVGFSGNEFAGLASLEHLYVQVRVCVCVCVCACVCVCVCVCVAILGRFYFLVF